MTQLLLKLSESILQNSESTWYLDVILNNKLKWGHHIENVEEKANKRLNLIKGLSGIIWGCSQEVRNTTHKLYIEPAIIYCNGGVTTNNTTNETKL